MVAVASKGIVGQPEFKMGKISSSQASGNDPVEEKILTN